MLLSFRMWQRVACWNTDVLSKISDGGRGILRNVAHNCARIHGVISQMNVLPKRFFSMPVEHGQVQGHPPVILAIILCA